MQDFARRLANLTSDRTTGASGLVTRAIDLLLEARATRVESLRRIMAAMCAAHPSMASIWNAVALALSRPGELEDFRTRVARAPRSLSRVALPFLAPGETDQPVKFVTCSASASVAVCLEALARDRPVTLACAEGRPLYEGRLMAERLAGRGIHVVLFTDAAVHTALEGSSAVLIGADAVAAAWFINKVGTGQLVATAVTGGVPVYVMASRDKFAHPTLAARLALKEGQPAEVWDPVPVSIEVRNPYFDRVPIDGVAAVVSDVGVLGAADLANACESAPVFPADFLVELSQSSSRIL